MPKLDTKNTENEISRIISQLNSGISVTEISKTIEDPILKFLTDYAISTGISLALVLDELKGVMRVIKEAQMQSQIALAGPKMTAKILQFLPLGGLLLGFILGVNPLAILFGSVAGWAMVAVGAFFWWLGVRITADIIEKYSTLYETDEGAVDSRVYLKLISSSLNAGMNMINIIEALKVEGADKLKKGMPWKICGLPSFLRPLEQVYMKGLSPVSTIDTLIEQITHTQLTAIREGGERMAVKLVLPLGLCFLPSFIVLGILPVVVSLLAPLGS